MTMTILCADDYAMTLGISAGIEELATAGRLSATSAMVTTPHWPSFGPRVSGLRERAAIGLHFNLTLGRPLAPMPKFAPDGQFGAVAGIIKRGAMGSLPLDEIEAEVTRQIDQFEAVAGVPPDFIDGHQHVQALPGVRKAFLAAIGRRSWVSRPLIRDPADTVVAIMARGAATGKSLQLAALALGFGTAVTAAGFPVNQGFSGASAFDERADLRPIVVHQLYDFRHVVNTDIREFADQYSCLVLVSLAPRTLQQKRRHNGCGQKNRDGNTRLAQQTPICGMHHASFSRCPFISSSPELQANPFRQRWQRAIVRSLIPEYSLLVQQQPCSSTAGFSKFTMQPGAN